MGYVKGRQLQFLVIVVLRLQSGYSHFRVPFIVTKHVKASIIIGNEFFDHQVPEIRRMKGVFEKIRVPVRILRRNKPTIDAEEADVGE